MEQEYYRDYHLPFARTGLIKYSELLEKLFERAGNYKKPGEEQKLLFSLLLKIPEIAENSLGPALALDEQSRDTALPKNWSLIINYLKREKLIVDFYFEPLFHDEPRIFRTGLFSPIDHKVTPTDGLKPRHHSYTHGDSLDLEEAISKSVGEFLERFTLLIYQEKDLWRASVDDLQKKGKFFLSPVKLAGFSEEQKVISPQLRINEKSNFLWTEGRSLFCNKAALIPVQLIFWAYNFAHRNWNEPRLGETNTNGAGGHYTLTKAILAGIYELIQRDSFLIYWLNHQAPPRISLETIDYQPLDALLQECQRLGFEINFFNTTTEIGIPSCICCFIDHSGIGPKISLGGGCDLNWDKMLMRSLIEAMGVFHWLRQSVGEGKWLSLAENYVPFQDASIEQLGRLSLWGNEKMFKNFEFFRQGKEESLAEVKKKFPEFSSSERELKYLIKIFKNLGKDYEIFYYQAKHKVLDDLGYASVKVIIPPLVPLYLKEIFAPLGSKRLKEVPPKLGFASAQNWNPWPHPFP